MNLSRIIERHAQFQPEQAALRFEGNSISYRALWQRIELVSSALAHRIGVSPGDHVAYLGYNHPEMLCLLFSLARIGAVLIPLNFRLARPELQSILDHAQSRILVAGAGFHETAMALTAQSTACLPVLMDVCAQPGAEGTPAHAAADVDAADPSAPAAVLHWEDITAPETPAEQALRRAALPFSGDDHDPVLIVYTSGTTGRPKGAVHTQQALIWNAINSIDYHDLTRTDHVLSSLPMFHVGGLCIQTLPALHAGATVSVHARFDPAAWLHDVAQVRPTLSLLVPATLKAVIGHSDWLSTDLSSLRMLNTGSSTVPEALMRPFLDRGVPVTQVYGSTETGPVSIYLKREDAIGALGSTGRVGLHVDVRLVNDQGADVAPGEIGEIWLHGPALMQGYWADPQNPSFRDGWFHSGDLARVDERGFYYVVGRSKDMIISGGENIYPAELENVLSDCPQIIEAAVVGQPDDRWGEVAVAAVVRQSGSMLDEAAVMARFHERIARFKHPRRVFFLDSLPKNAMGKMQKTELQRVLAERAGADPAERPSTNL